MKNKLLTIGTVLLIGILLVLFQSCKHDDELTPDVFESKLIATWKTVRVTVDDLDVSGAFKDMILTLSADQHIHP
ncbi:MAG: hypothetical protein WDO15_11775 [Bacteroidota bacterium]